MITIILTTLAVICLLITLICLIYNCDMERTKLVMNNLDWGKTTEERNNNIGVYNTIKTEEEKQVFLTNLKYGTDKISSI